MTAEVGEQVGDAELAAGFRRDPDLFTAVFDKHFPEIYRYVARRLDPQAAEDVAAETFLLAFDQRGRFDPGRGGLRAWLFGIATNLVARHRRKEARRYKALARADAAPVADSHESGVVDAVTAQRLQPRLARALAALNQGERDVLLLVASQLSHQEVAEALGIAYGTVGTRLSRARKKIHDSIGPEAFNG